MSLCRLVNKIDAAIEDSHGQMLHCEVSGKINGHSGLSSVLDLTIMYVDKD
ncbi:hypothetical protein H310_12310 [Aphanomyces invadans]|uniref:Uncharacterized protein n=1 Tax=Aphanomyces invadans TaxID=157072 RepID=A0A024TIA7_9STRA|nr:hypothetical protein H310_12310 [Aphanomyces invadans]ETV93734.1 hypothetical protein H310_12310 [Aphanomyces invadans]|eukprot:XP_008877543.1 hypothetical protein H310_12310 [Aphanomyces invadans]